MKQKFYIHETSIIDKNVKIGIGTKICIGTYWSGASIEKIVQ